ncbi:sulfatase-like hydrolase/transferase [Pelagicoccus mobilis]|uniref:Sulfatase-like hydrolase/transferase n=1 Tax=Pelagicoccus mobilis TaxID=415221 RepID=A0A934VJZ5_9BACT|nr:sulfatase-like hydrolase/transferase [Pelagicoccus mobilis]MBK1876126.1 sulfatase-like hydrolase/transferase [Pelagicoccus mobilis]
MVTSPVTIRPNVLLIVADDHRADCIAGNRESGPATPVLDALANRGTLINGARIGGGHNPAVCVPSRAAIMTGRAPDRALKHPRSQCNSENQEIREDLTTIGKTFRENGYITHVVGKWHNDTKSLNRSFVGGTNIFLDGMSEHENPLLHDYSPKGNYGVETAHVVPGFSSQIFADGAVDFLQKREQGESPFFLYLAFTSPHDPRTPPEEYRQRYDAKRIELPQNFLPEHPFDNGELLIRDEQLASFPRTEDEVQRQTADYYALIEHHDNELGRVISALKESGEYENTLIIYTSDHGLAMGSHGLLGKQNLYEHSIKVPMILAGPGVDQQDPIKNDIPSYSIFPTLCDMLDIPIPATVEAESFVDLLTKPREHRVTEPTPYFSHYRDIQRAVNWKHWKLIRYEVGGEVRLQLFNLSEDEGEMQNLANDHTHQAILHELLEALETWWSHTARIGMVERDESTVSSFQAEKAE